MEPENTMTKPPSELTFKRGGKRKAKFLQRPMVRLRCAVCRKLLNRQVPKGSVGKTRAYCMECA